MKSVLVIITPEQGWPNVWERVLKLFLNFKEILSRAEENFEEWEKVFESPANYY